MCSGSALSRATSSRALGGRQARRRLVEQDQPRRPGERHADLELALLAVGQGAHRLIGDVREAHALKQLLRRAARGVRGARPQEAETAARDAARGEE